MTRSQYIAIVAGVVACMLFVTYLIFACVIPIGCTEVCKENGVEVPC